MSGGGGGGRPAGRPAHVRSRMSLECLPICPALVGRRAARSRVAFKLRRTQHRNAAQFKRYATPHTLNGRTVSTRCAPSGWRRLPCAVPISARAGLLRRRLGSGSRSSRARVMMRAAWGNRRFSVAAVCCNTVSAKQAM